MSTPARPPAGGAPQARPGPPPLSAAADAMLTMRPQPAAIMSPITACVTR